MTDQQHYVCSLEWSESPYHNGLYQVYLAYRAKSGRWTLSFSRPPGDCRLSWCRGDGTEDPGDVARRLLRQSRKRSALPFDCVDDSGPFEISLADICEERTRFVQTDTVSKPPARICKYCRHLKKPEGSIAAMGKIYDCHKGHWDDSVRGCRGRGVRNPNLEFSCDEFEAEFATRKESYYG
jgi:hypothetical protein